MLLQKVGDWGNGWMETLAKVGSERIVKTAAVQTTITSNPKTGMKFLNLFGDTFPIKAQLSAMGFRYFKGTWGMPLEMAKGKMAELAALGIDTSVLTSEQALAKPEMSTGTPQAAPVDPAAPQAPQVPQTQTDKTLAEMRAAMDAEMKSAPADEKSRRMTQFIDSMIEKISGSVDEAAKQDFVRSFLAFASKFHEYSFGNQMFIWIQRPDASYVSGFKQWMEKGRQVVKWDRPIHIIRPQMNKKTLSEGERAALPPDQQGNGVRQWMSFKPAQVYDISDTAPIAGWKDKEGRGPFERPPLKTEPNELEDQITQLVQAGVNFSQKLGIVVDLEKDLEEGHGGYSAGGDIAINKTFKGINQFGTLAHEMAHEILHRQDDQKTPIKESRQNKEIDAETTAYIVLKHYGYDSKDAPNYLALWKGTGDLVRARRNNISKAVKIIIDGIDKEMGNVIKFEDEGAPEAAPAAAPMITPASWVASQCKFAQQIEEDVDDKLEDLEAERPLNIQQERAELTPLVNALPSDVSKDLKPAINQPSAHLLHQMFLDFGQDPSAQQKLRSRLQKTPMSDSQGKYKQPKQIVMPPKPTTTLPPPPTATHPLKP